jgi:hypothetical protein
MAGMKWIDCIALSCIAIETLAILRNDYSDGTRNSPGGMLLMGGLSQTPRSTPMLSQKRKERKKERKRP